jgi:hypothetical protein
VQIMPAAVLPDDRYFNAISTSARVRGTSFFSRRY